MAIEIEELDLLIQNFMMAKATMTEASKKSYLSTLSRFDTFCLEKGIELSKVQDKHVAEYLQQFSERAFKTRLSYKKILKSFYMWLEKRGSIPYNPVEDIIIKGNSRAKRIDPMSKDDFNQILQRAQDLNVLTILNVLYYTGLRSRELIEVKLDDIDPDCTNLYVSVSKSSNGNRTIPILKDLKPILQFYLKKRKEMDLDHDYVFVNKHGNKLKYRTLLHYVKQSQRGMDTDYAVHDFRRAFGTNVYHKLGDLITCQQLLGHSSVDTTRNYILGDNKRLDNFRKLDGF